MIAKSGHLFCKEYLAFVRRLPCYFCRKPGPSDPHHFPPKGRGVTRDDLTVASCRECHMRCGGQTVNGKLPINRSSQDEGVERTRSLFLSMSSDEELMAYLDARKAWRLNAMIVPL